MERGLLRTSLNGSALVGWLTQLSLADVPAARPSVVDGLGQWLGWKDAIALAGALQTPAAAAPGQSTHRAGTAPPDDTRAAALAGPLAAEVDRVCGALGQAITRVTTPPPVVRGGRGASRPVPGRPAEDEADFDTHRRRCLALQRAMATGLLPLRAQARTALERLSPALARLAALDAVLETVLAEREQAALAGLVTRLQRHFERLQADAAAAAAPGAMGAPPATPPAPPPAARPALRPAAMPPGQAPWLQTFRHDMRGLLMAELDLRLQPTLGLLDALRAGPRAGAGGSP